MVFQSVHLEKVQGWKINFLFLGKCTTHWSQVKARIHWGHKGMYLALERKRELSAGSSKENNRPTSLLQRQICWKEWAIMYRPNTAEERWLTLKIQTKSWPCSSVLLEMRHSVSVRTGISKAPAFFWQKNQWNSDHNARSLLCVSECVIAV